MRMLARPLLLLFPLLGCVPAEPTVHAAWVRAAPDGSALRVAYLDITNPGPADWIVSVSSDAHETASLHESLLDDGVARMRPRKRVELPPGTTVNFGPGGLHVMLGAPRRPLSVGDTLTLTVSLASGKVIPASALVSRQQP